MGRKIEVGEWQRRVGAYLDMMIRTDRRLSTSSVARAAGIDRGTLQLYLDGERAMPLGVLERICRGIDVPLSTVVSATDPAHVPFMDEAMEHARKLGIADQLPTRDSAVERSTNSDDRTG